MNEGISVSTVISIKFADGQTVALPEPDPNDSPNTVACMNALRTALLAQHSAPAAPAVPAPAA